MNIVTIARRNALVLLFSALVLRAIVPVGYMPGSLDSGLLFEMCPDGMPAAMVQALGGHHDHGGSDEEAATQSLEHCPMGHLLTPGAGVSSVVAALPPPHKPVFLVAARQIVAIAPRIVYSSRAPPVQAVKFL